jgi:uncharacterized MnhB-related membrane protein
VQFSGEVTERHIARAYSATPRSSLYIAAFFAVVFVSPLFAVVFNSISVGQSYPSWLLLAAGIGLSIAIVGVFLSLATYLPFIMSLKVRGLVLRRPWLLGLVHGTFSAACTTIWHKDLGVQLVSQDLPQHLSFNAYVVRANRRPFALVPTSSFFKRDWHTVLDTLELRQTGFLQSVPPPMGSHVCILESQRLSFLEMRLRGYRWVGGTSGGIWISAVAIAFFAARALNETVPFWLVLGSVPVLILLLYLLRVALWTWHTKRQFSSEKRGYLLVPEDHPERTVSWFNEEVVFWCAGRMWLHIPMRYVDRIRVGFSVIEFRAKGTEMLFHREGFQSHANWIAACNAARSLVGHRTDGAQ